MRVLILHSRYLSGPISGENRVVNDEADLLRAAGHDVEVLSPSPEGIGRPALAARSLVSSGTAAAVRELVRAHRIEVVHCHNLYPALGAGVLPAASRAGAAVVITLHNFRLMCPAGTFFRDGHVCEDCLGRVPWPAVMHACYRGSRAETALLGASITLAKTGRGFGSVHRFLAVSDFIRKKHAAAGLPQERIALKANFVPGQRRREGPGRYFLVLGRLSTEKGVSEIVRAWTPDVGELRIVGDGPERPSVERLAAGNGVRLEGPAEPTAIPDLLAGARALVVPSTWFEGQPRVILEAYAAGVPVIASRIGGLPEVVLDGQTGITVPIGDPDGWRAAALQLADDSTSIRLGEGAHLLWRERFSPDCGLAALESAYEDVLQLRARSR